MNWLRKRREENQTGADETIECPHVTLVARWDRADDIGNNEAAAAFRCEACGEEFTPDEVERLRETERERLQEKLAS